MIEKFIIQTEQLNRLAPKPRARRGTRMRNNQIIFSRPQLDRMLQIARQAGDKEMIAALSPKRSLASCKRDLIASIRHGKSDTEAWNAYVEVVNSQSEALKNGIALNNS